SSRPGADDVAVEVELQRVYEPVAEIRRHFPELQLSVDTFRPAVAESVLQLGVSMINDIAGGRDVEMLRVVGKHSAAYVAMHMQGVPKTMQVQPTYGDVVEEVRDYLRRTIAAARSHGIDDVWIDPGFGFGKSLTHNYQ